MKLKRLISLAGILAAVLIFTGGSLYADDAVAVQSVQGFAGGSDTVNVYITSTMAYTGAEIGISFDKTKLSYVDASLAVNSQAWDPSWGTPEVSVDSTTGKVSVVFFSLNVAAIIPQSSQSLKLFSVVLKAADGLTPGPIAMTPSGIFVETTADYQTVQHNVVDLSAGQFTIISSYSLYADSVQGSLNALVPVPIYLTNLDPAVSLEFTLNFNSAQLYYGDSVELNTAIWENGNPPTLAVTDGVGTVKVGIMAQDAAQIPVSSSKVWIAKVYMQTAPGAVESASNPITMSGGLVVTHDAQYNLTSNTPNMVNGNFDILSKFSLRVSNDANAPQGGSDTVKVYLKNAMTIVGAEAVLKFNAADFTASAGSIVFNKAIFSNAGSSVEVTSNVTDSTVNVSGIPVSADSVAPSEQEKLLFSVILNAKTTAATGYDSLSVSSATVTTRDADFNTSAVAVAALTKGAFLVHSPFEAQVQSVFSKPLATQTVNVMLTNRDRLGGTEVVITFDSALLTFVSGSVTANNAVWEGGAAPTPDIVAGGDSVKVGLFDVSSPKFIAAGGSSQVLFSLQFTPKPAMVNGTVTVVNAHGSLAVVDANYNTTNVALTVIPGTFSVLNDITPPGPVGNVTGALVAQEIDLTWTNPTDADLNKVVITRRSFIGESVVVFSGLATSFVDNTISTSMAYRYVFQAFDNVGNGSDTVTTPFIGQTVDRPGLDFNNDGKINAGDLYFYLANPGVETVDSLAALIVYLLEQPVPATMLAAQQNTGNVVVAKGAAYVELKSNLDVIVARFTFSYDNTYQVSEVVLNKALQGKAFIKPMFQNGKLLVDVISLSGFVPSELGGEVFRVQFKDDREYTDAKLTLEKVEVADRTGKVYGGEKAGIMVSAVLPKAFSLAQNSPNPFNPSTNISYEIPETSSGVKVVLAVYNIRGQKVITLVDELKEAGRYTVNWDGRSESGQRVSSGVYFYRLQAGDFTSVRKMVILK
jgi:hypothetical protein